MPRALAPVPESDEPSSRDGRAAWTVRVACCARIARRGMGAPCATTLSSRVGRPRNVGLARAVALGGSGLFGAIATFEFRRLAEGGWPQLRTRWGMGGSRFAEPGRVARCRRAGGVGLRDLGGGSQQRQPQNRGDRQSALQERGAGPSLVGRGDRHVVLVLKVQDGWHVGLFGTKRQWRLWILASAMRHEHDWAGVIDQKCRVKRIQEPVAQSLCAAQTVVKSIR